MLRCGSRECTLVTLAAALLMSVACYGGSSKNAPSGEPTKSTSKPAPAKKTVKATGRTGANKGDSAYDFILTDSNGKVVRLSDFKGKVVVLDFWATWCSPCRKEIPGFVALQREYKDKGVEVVGISIDQGGWDAVDPFVKEHGINYTIVMGDDDIGEQYGGIDAIPMTFIINREGVIQDSHRGYGPPEFFEKAVEEAL